MDVIRPKTGTTTTLSLDSVPHICDHQLESKDNCDRSDIAVVGSQVSSVPSVPSVPSDTNTAGLDGEQDGEDWGDDFGDDQEDTPQNDRFENDDTERPSRVDKDENGDDDDWNVDFGNSSEEDWGKLDGDSGGDKDGTSVMPFESNENTNKGGDKIRDLATLRLAADAELLRGLQSEVRSLRRENETLRRESPGRA